MVVIDYNKCLNISFSYQNYMQIRINHVNSDDVQLLARDDSLYNYIYTLYTLFRESVEILYSDKPQLDKDEYFKTIHETCLNKYNTLNNRSIKGFPSHVDHINKKTAYNNMDKYQRNRFLKLKSINDKYSYNINHLTDDLIDAYNNTWCLNNAFSLIEDKRLKVNPLVLIPPHPDPGERRP